MLYTSSKADLKKMLVGIGAEIQGTDRSEVAYEEILDKCKQNTR
jgi:cofilin